MAHILAKLTGVRIEDVQQQLTADAEGHAAKGWHLEHVWQNADDPTEALFLFRADDLAAARRLIGETHARAQKEDPDAKLPQMTFLEER